MKYEPTPRLTTTSVDTPLPVSPSARVQPVVSVLPGSSEDILIFSVCVFITVLRQTLLDGPLVRSVEETSLLMKSFDYVISARFIECVTRI